MFGLFNLELRVQRLPRLKVAVAIAVGAFALLLFLQLVLGHEVIHFFGEVLTHVNDVILFFHLLVEMIETFFAGLLNLVHEFIFTRARGQRFPRLDESKSVGGVALLECGVENLEGLVDLSFVLRDRLTSKVYLGAHLNV